MESGIVGRSQGAPLWPPVTSRSSMLIMEPVNANNKTLPVLRSWEWMWDKNENPLSPFPLPRCLSVPLCPLTLNYHYWALGTESSLLHLSDVGHWRALSHIQYPLLRSLHFSLVLPAYLPIILDLMWTVVVILSSPFFSTSYHPCVSFVRVNPQWSYTFAFCVFTGQAYS